jgi:hypothetical protein
MKKCWCYTGVWLCMAQTLIHNRCVEGTQEKQTVYMKRPHSIQSKYIPVQMTFLVVQVTQLLEGHELLHSTEALDLNSQPLLLQMICYHEKEWGCLPYLTEVRHWSLFYNQRKCRLPVILNSSWNKLINKNHCEMQPTFSNTDARIQPEVKRKYNL